MSGNEKDKVLENKKSKKKKIILVASGMTLSLGLFVNYMYSNINDAQNEFTGVSSSIYLIEEIQRSRNELLLGEKENLYKYDEMKIAFDEFEKENAKLKIVMTFAEDTQEVNEATKKLIEAENSVDKILNIYTNSEKMKRDKKIVEKMDEIIASSYNVETSIKLFNKENVESFNKSINKQPIKLMQGKYDIEKINKIEVK